MKNFLVLFFATTIVFCGFYSYAQTTDPADCSGPGTCDPGHTHDYSDIIGADTQNGDELGAGADVVLFQSNFALMEEVTAEYRYDNYTKNQKAYLVARVNVFRLIKNFFKK
jgi:hypothetical protein